MRRALSLAILLLFSIAAMPQSPVVTGTLSDTAAGRKLFRGSVALLKMGDSILIRHSRSDVEGAFRLTAPDTGKYLLLITYPNYADYFDQISISSEGAKLGDIPLTPKSKLMEEILVKKRVAAIQYRGDTTFYTADSFKVKAGASVEDLLRVMPGFTIDKSGKITAQGERVQKVLVDGEEFFSDDPTIATRNLNADMVQNVEVFNKKSDKAEFTGIDDGSKTKTINLKLKEEKKNGYFGKVDLGTDLKNFYNNNAMANYFKGKRKFSAYGILSNNGKTGLNWSESTNYGGGNNNMEMGTSDDGGMYMILNGNGDEFDNNNYQGEGIPRAIAMGAHYSDKWANDKQHINGNYRFNQIDNDANITTKTQFILPDTLYYNNETNHTYNYRNRNLLEGVYDINLDSSSSIKVRMDGSLGLNKKENDYTGESVSADGAPVNNTRRTQTSEGDNKTLNANLSYRKKFKKQGHSLSLSMKETFTESGSNGFLHADNSYYDSKGFVVRHDTIDQRKLNDNRALGLSGTVSYTRPISKRSYLSWDYGLEIDNRQTARTTLERTDPNKPQYDQTVAALTNSFNYDVMIHRLGMYYRYNKPKKINFNIGGKAISTRMDQSDLVRDTSRRYTYWNFAPQAGLNLQMKKNRNLWMNYNGQTQQPSIQQLQPIVDNSDPLNVYIGNPSLRPSFSHNLWLNFGQFDIIEEKNMWIGASINTTQHAFGSRDLVDSIGRRVYQTVNVDGNYNYNLNFNYNIKVKKTPLSVSLGTSIAGSNYVNFINGQKNITSTIGLGIEPNMTYYVDKKFNIAIFFNLRYNRSTSSIRPDVNTDYWVQEHRVEGSVQLPWKLEWETDVNFFIRQKTDVFQTNNNVVLWNMSLFKKIGKDDKFRFGVMANDLLNQNIGFKRDISTNYISEKTYNTYRQYFMVSLRWNFARNGKPQDF